MKENPPDSCIREVECDFLWGTEAGTVWPYLSLLASSKCFREISALDSLQGLYSLAWWGWRETFLIGGDELGANRRSHLAQMIVCEIPAVLAASHLPPFLPASSFPHLLTHLPWKLCGCRGERGDLKLQERDILLLPSQADQFRWTGVI